MDVYHLAEGEGIACRPRFALTTTPLLNCLGIALVGEFPGLFGLYHYPSGTLRLTNVQNTLIQMITNVNPRSVIVNYNLDSRDDRCEVVEFLENKAKVKTEINRVDKELPIATLYWEQGELKVNQSVRGFDQKSVPTAMRNVLQTGARSHGNIDYYGGNCKDNPNFLRAQRPIARPRNANRVRSNSAPAVLQTAPPA